MPFTHTFLVCCPILLSLTDNAACYTTIFTKHTATEDSPPTNNSREPKTQRGHPLPAPTNTTSIPTHGALKPATKTTASKHRISLTTDKEADNAAQVAINPRIQLLPNAEEQRDVLGKSSIDAKKSGLMWPSGPALAHPAAPLLHEYATGGCPVDCGPDWSRDQIEAALQYGSHPSAQQEEARECLIQETRLKVEEGFAKIVTYKDIKHKLPKKLKLSPIAMIPHKSRKFRAILDLSFQLRAQKDKKHPSVNDATVKQAPANAMRELGNVVKRILAKIEDGRQQDPNVEFMFAKLDIKDGFWRLVVNEEDAWNFCYAVPNKSHNTPLDETQIVVPNSLQMGWCESPPFFCAASETGRDVIAKLLKTELPPHRLEERMLPKNFDTLPATAADLASLTTLIEVYVDDFIGCIDTIAKENILRVSRAMLHGIHSIFPPPAQTGHNGGDPISEKKLMQLEGQWDNIKEILGWIMDGKRHTIALPPKKVEKVKAALKRMKKKRWVPLKEFQKLAGILHHASIGMPGGRGLFTGIWKAMAQHANNFVRLTDDLKAILDDFKWLFCEVANKPIRIAQLVPHLPKIHGYVDACRNGIGGVWIIPTASGRLRLIVWAIDIPADLREKFDQHILTINDFEMAGILCAWLVLECVLPSMTNVQAGIRCDNTSAVHWSKKFTARSRIAGHLLRALALRQQLSGSAPFLVCSIPGSANDMADVASRYHSDPVLQARAPSLLHYFNTFFKQEDSWEEFHLPRRLILRVMSSLRGTQLTLESWRRLPKLEKNTGKNGASMQSWSRSTPSSNLPIPSSETWSSPHSLHGSGLATTARAVKSEFKESLMPFRPSARRSNWLD